MDDCLQVTHEIRHLCTEGTLAYFAIQSRGDEIVDYVQLF